MKLPSTSLVLPSNTEPLHPDELILNFADEDDPDMLKCDHVENQWENGASEACYVRGSRLK